ncbi:uncharacterized protein CC84DRAFT_1211415 [Paraphaeosphaeria sporulosa]|uniref:C3H1-type domain-containing protein n=1 Tax=Paraphaeosphaeria sporulosa TaxID=1460663 RepID=A0A177CY71_9PLEO|nr:uncharacterized protein CC84DRAFT_1211415 [Paraphaeosphaeria sporulosa]OAG11777.1 hypothetical protein CC84DRAFT_1211415 [Paraphaeosphaeria sporulosa]
MQGTTWAAVAAGSQVQAPASAVVPTSKKSQLSAIANDGQNSTAAKVKSRSANASDANSDVPKKDVTAGTKSTIVAVLEKTSTQKNNHKEKESAVVSKPPNAIEEQIQKAPDAVTSSVVGASHTLGANKKKKLLVNAPESTVGNLSPHLKITSQDNVTDSSLPVANEVSITPIKKRNKIKMWKAGHKVKDAKKVVHEVAKSTLKPSGVINGADQQVFDSNVHNPANNAMTANKSDAVLAEPDRKGLEYTSIVECVHVSTAVSEAALASDASAFDTPTPAALPLVETELLEQPKHSAHAHKNSDSTELSVHTVQDAGIARTRSVVSRKRITHHDVETYVVSLGLPGISFDEFGVCIASDAPDWVRGRVARRVYWLVSDFKAGKTATEIDIATELELEKKEKTHFHQAVWDRLFLIEDWRNPISDQERLDLEPMMREFDMKLAARLISDSPSTKVDDKVGEEKPLDKVDTYSSSLLSIGEVEFQPPVHQQTNFQQDHSNNDTQVLRPNFRLPSQELPPANRVVPGLHSSFKATANDHSYLVPFMLDPSLETSSLQENGQNSPQHHRPASRQLCHNFANGYCYYRTACHFIHAGPGEVQAVAGPSQGNPQEHNQNPRRQRQSKSTQPCRNYVKGYCPYGATCHYVHIHHGEYQAVAESCRQDSTYDVFDFSRSVSRSSNNRGTAGRLNSQSNDRRQSTRAPSSNARVSGYSKTRARLTPDSHSSTQGSARGSRPNKTPQKKKKDEPKHKGGKKSQNVNH